MAAILRQLRRTPSMEFGLLTYFVHINSEEFSSYAAEFARVLKPGGFVVIQHGSTGGSGGGNRSNVTTAQVYEFMSNNGLEVQEGLSNIGKISLQSRSAFRRYFTSTVPANPFRSRSRAGQCSV
jgi:hypothetical protein